MSRKPTWIAISLLLVGLGTVACGPSAEEQQAAAREAEWKSVQQLHDQLEGKREQLAELRRQMKAAEEQAAEAGETATEATGEAGEATAASAEDLSAKVEAMQAEVDDMTQQFGEALVGFINANPPVQGEPLSEVQNAAVRMKSDEDILLAREYIEKGGDFRRAIKIYRDALSVDPDYKHLEELLAEAEAMRFMTEERFAQAEKGMTPDQVRELLGPVNLRNIRHFEEDKVTAWYYPKDEQGSAAAVWFREGRKGGGLEVYQLQFDAVKGGAGSAEDVE